MPAQNYKRIGTEEKERWNALTAAVITHVSLIPDQRRTTVPSAAEDFVMTAQKRFTTYEKVETIPLIIIKKDNTREQYNRSKIEDGVLRACHNARYLSTRSINSSTMWRRKSSIWKKKEISSSVIGELVMDKLKDLEAVAYVRFASVYREFKDVNTFVEELKKVLDK
mgnify:CR=1 FL=1